MHTHVFPDKLAAHALAELAQPGRHEPYYDGTLRGLLAMMDRAGIERSVTVPVATKASQVDTINRFASTQPRDRIIPFGAIHPDVEDPAAVLATFPALGLRGFKMHPDYQSCAPDDPRMEPIWEAAVDLGLIALFHAGSDVGPQTVLGHPRAFAHVLDAYPGLTLVLAHFGGYLCWNEVAELLVGRDVWLDTSYTLAHIDPDLFLRMVDEHGTHRVLFGSDGPWVDPSRDIAYLQGCGLPEPALERIFHENAERLLSMPA